VPLTCGHRGKPNNSEEKLIDNLIKLSGFSSQHYEDLEKNDNAKQLKEIVSTVRRNSKRKPGSGTQQKKVAAGQSEEDPMLRAVDADEIQIDFENDENSARKK